MWTDHSKAAGRCLLTRMKLGLFLFLQLKDGTLISGYLPSWRTSHPLWVCPLRMRRGLNHCSSWGDTNPASHPARDRLLLTYIITVSSQPIIIIVVVAFIYRRTDADSRWRYCILMAWCSEERAAGALTFCEASFDSTSYFSLNSRWRSSGGAASSPVQPASLTLYSG